MIVLSLVLLPLGMTILIYLSGKISERLRDGLILMTLLVELGLLLRIVEEVAVGKVYTFSLEHVMGIGLYLRLDAFRMLFALLATIAWFLVTAYAIKYLERYERRNRYYLFHMLTYAGTMGMFLSDNLLNLFMFFELLSVTSYALIIHDEDQYSHEAGSLYIGMAIGGGLIQLLGLFILYGQVGTLNLPEIQSMPALSSTAWFACVLIILGYFVKASVFPFHIWLPKAHPAAPTPASALLSGVLIKTGVFGIIIVSEYILHAEIFISVILVVLGLVNALVGGILALYQRNLKRIMAYSSMSQVGYIIATIGLTGLMGSKGGIAIFSSLYHIINHGFFKVLLFLAVGFIYRALHEVSLNNIRGYGKYQPLLLIVFFVGFAAVCGVPGTSGFVSKALMHDALVEAEHIVHSPLLVLIELLFTLASCITFAYAGKIFIEIFVKQPYKENNEKPNDYPFMMVFPLLMLIIITLVLGMQPQWMSDFLEMAVHNLGFSIHHIPSAFALSSVMYFLVTLLGGGLIIRFFVNRRLTVNIAGRTMFVNPAIHWFSLETSIYRPLLKMVLTDIPKAFQFIDDTTVMLFEKLQKLYRSITRTERVEAFTKKVTNMIGEVGVVLLALFVLFVYVVLAS